MSKQEFSVLVIDGEEDAPPDLVEEHNSEEEKSSETTAELSLNSIVGLT